ncbi:MAG: hypothetical protein PHP50_09600 [Lachnospiraceae bacterium]|nr:hypothetical protein [Lachnospiraceae bacterium]
MGKTAEYLKRKKKEEEEKQNTVSSSENTKSKTREYLLKKNINEDTLQDDYKSIGSTLDSVYGGWQDQNTMSSARTKVSDMYKRLNDYKEYQNNYSGADNLDDFNTGIDQAIGSLKAGMDSWDGLSELYGQYQNADAYSLAKNKSDLKKKYNGLSYDQVQEKLKTTEEGSEDYNFLKEYGVNVGYDNLDDYDKELNARIGSKVNNTATSPIKLNDPESKLANKSFATPQDTEKKILNPVSDEMKTDVETGQNVINETKPDREYKDKLETQRNQYALDNGFDAYAGLMNNEDFEDVVNNNYDPEFWDDKKGNFEVLDDDEKNTYTYILKTKGQSAADQFMRDMDITLSKRRSDEDQGQIEAWLNDGSSIEQAVKQGLMSVGSVPLSIAGGITAFADDAIRSVTGSDKNSGGSNMGETNPYDTAHFMQNSSDTIRNTTRENIEKNTDAELFGQNIPSFLYDTALSSAESVLGVNTFGKGFTAVMGMNAASQKAKELKDAGANENDIVTGATLSGIAEAAFEHFSVDQLIKAKDTDSVGRLVKNVITQMGIEGEEEMATELANTVSDYFVRGGLSDLSKTYDGYVEQGYSEEEAKEKSAIDVLSNVAWAGAGGALAGGISAAGESARNLAENKSMGSAIKSDGNTKNTFDLAESYEKGSESEKYLSELDKKGKTAENVKDAELGSLYNRTWQDTAKNGNEDQKQKFSDLTAPSASYDTKTGKNVKVQGLIEENGKSFVITDKGKIKASQIKMNINDSLAVNYAEEMDVNKGNAFLEQYDGQTDVDDYATSFDLIYNYGLTGFGADTALQHKGVLTENQVKEIYNTGVKDSVSYKQNTINSITEKFKGKTISEGKVDDSVIDFTNSGKGKVNFSSLTSRQRNAVSIISGFSKTAGINLVWEASTTEEQDNGSPNGWYDRKDNTIHLDVNAGMSSKVLEDAMVPTMSHETTHWMKEKAPEAYAEIREIVMNTLQNSPDYASHVGVDALALAESYEMVQSGENKNATAEDAVDEMVARACEDMFSGSEYVTGMLSEMSESNKKTFMDHIREVIANVKSWIQDVLKQYSSKSREAEVLRSYSDMLDNLQKKWDEALKKSVEANNAVKQEQTEKEEVAPVQLSTRGKDNISQDEIAEQISKIIKKGEYEFYGVRIDDFDYDIGDICNNSHQLYQDPMYDENDNLIYPEGTGNYREYYDAGELNGTSCIQVDSEDINDNIEKIKQYEGKNLYLIAGNYSEGGNDSNEIVIEKAKVLYKKDLETIDGENRKFSRRNNLANGLNGEEWKYFKKQIGHIRENFQYEKGENGDTIVPVGNKLVYTDGDFENPGISKIIEFDLDNETDIDYARRIIYAAIKEGKSEIEKSVRIIEKVFGHGVVHRYDGQIDGSVRRYDRRTKRGKSQSNAYHSEFMQDTIRRAREIAGFGEKEQFSRRKSYDINELLDRNDTLEKENSQLKADVKRLNERNSILKENNSIQRTVTGGRVLSNSKIEAAADVLLVRSGSDYGKKKLSLELKEFYSWMVNEDNLDAETVNRKSYEIASHLMESQKNSVSADPYVDEILKDIRGTKVSLTEEQMQEVKYIYGSNYKSALRWMVSIDQNAISLDTMWQEWCERYPGIFSQMATGDQITGLVDVVEDLERSKQIVEYGVTDNEVRRIASEVYNQFWNVDTVPTVADRFDQKLKEINFKHRQAMKDLRERYQKNLADQKKETREHYEKIIRSIRSQKNEDIRSVKKNNKERMAEYRERNARKEEIQKIVKNTLSLSSWMNENSAKHHVPDAMKEPVAKLLTAIDFSSKRMQEGEYKPTKTEISLSEALENFSNLIMQIDYDADAETSFEMYVDLPKGFTEEIRNISTTVNSIMRSVGDNEFVLNEMTSEQLKSLNGMIRVMRSSISKLNDFLSFRNTEEVGEVSRTSIQEMQALGKKKHGIKPIEGIKDFLGYENALPYYVFKKFGSGAQKIFFAIQDGWDSFAFKVKAAIDYANDAYTTKEAREWEDDIKEFEIMLPRKTEDVIYGGEPKYTKVKMTVPQIMSLYCLQKRDQAKTHLHGGGMRVADFEEKGKKISQAEGVTLADSEIKKIIDSLSDRQREVADRLQNFMNTTASDWGNEVSMKRFGIRQFGEKNYFPIKSDDNNLTKDDAKEQENSLFRILNMSFTKSTTRNANNRVVIEGIFDVFAQHASDMAKYNALALPVLDAFKWYNYREKTEVGDTQFDTNSVKQEMERTFGKEAKKYFTNFLKDLNGDSDGGRSEGIMKGAMTRYKIAAVGGNIRVALLQPTAYVRASAVMSPKYLTKALLFKKPSVTKAQENSGIAQWKALGFYDTNITRNVKQQIKHDESVVDKIEELSLTGAEWGDKITWGYLWNACEAEIKDKTNLKIDSEEYLKAVSDRFREIIYQTQVVDSTMTRTNIMRSRSGLTQMATSFMSEPSVTYNMVADAFTEWSMDAREHGGYGRTVSKHGRKFARTMSVYALTAAVSGIVGGAVAIMRGGGDDEDEDEELYDILIENILSEANPLTKLPLVKDVVSVLSGYDPTRMDEAFIQSSVSAAKKVMKYIEGEDVTPYETAYSVLKAVSQTTGLPISNTVRDAVSMWNQTIGNVYHSMEIK